MADAQLHSKELITEQLVELVAACMVSNWTKGRIKREVINEAAGYVVRQDIFEQLFCLARAMIAERGNIDKQTELVNQIAYLKELIADEHEETRFKLEAMKMLQDLMGIGAKWSSGALDPMQFARQVKEAQTKMDTIAGLEE